MVNKSKAAAFKVQLENIVAKHGYPAIEKELIEVKIETIVAEKAPEVKLETPIKPSNDAKQYDWWNIL
ncbi:hypothetical protein D3C86_2143430 [compost metagenome]